MKLSQISAYLIVLNAGFVSFLSPCIVPLIPVYVSFMSGRTLEEMTVAQDGKKLKILPEISLFILGFTSVFILMGMGAAYFGSLLSSYRGIISRISGLLIILLALNLAGVIELPIPQKRNLFFKSSFKLLTAFLLGIAFAVSWSPCIGPLLGSVLLYTAAEKTVFEGICLLLSYSMGIAIPFLLTALSLQLLLPFIRRFKKTLVIIQKVSSIVLIIFGLLMLTDTLTVINLPV